MSKFSKALRTANTAASIVIAIGVAVDLYDRFKCRIIAFSVLYDRLLFKLNNENMLPVFVTIRLFEAIIAAYRVYQRQAEAGGTTFSAMVEALEYLCLVKRFVTTISNNQFIGSECNRHLSTIGRVDKGIFQQIGNKGVCEGVIHTHYAAVGNGCRGCY